MYNTAIYVPRGNGGSGPPTPSGALHITIEAAAFIGNSTPPIPQLVGKTPEVNFDVWTHPADGYGGLTTFEDYYTHNAGTGALTLPGGPERIKIII